jgi:hypothetical protein
VTSAFAAARVRAAREHLVHLASRLGRGGIAAAHSRPGLLAALDQHTAAIRDRLGDGWRVPSAAALAGYAAGLRDRAAEHSWTVPSSDEIDWAFAEWPVLRFVAVCALAREAGVA